MKSKVRNILHCATLKITQTTITEVSCIRLHVCDASTQLMNTFLKITEDFQLNENNALKLHHKREQCHSTVSKDGKGGHNE